jgi:hypothetical protein
MVERRGEGEGTQRAAFLGESEGGGSQGPAGERRGEGWRGERGVGRGEWRARRGWRYLAVNGKGPASDD